MFRPSFNQFRKAATFATRQQRNIHFLKLSPQQIKNPSRGIVLSNLTKKEIGLLASANGSTVVSLLGFLELAGATDEISQDEAHNKSYAEGKIQEAEKYKATLIEKFPDEAQAYIENEYCSLLEQTQNAIEQYHVQKDIDEAKRKCEVSWKDFEKNYSRFPDRSQKALESMTVHIEILKKYSPLVASNWEAKVKEGTKMLSEQGIRASLEKAVSSTKTPLGQAETELYKLERPDQVIRYLEQALSNFEKNFEDNADLRTADPDLVQEYRAKFYDQYMQLKKGLEQLNIKKDIKKDGDNMVQQMNHAKMYFERNRSQAQGYYEKGIGQFDDFVTNPRYIDHPLRGEYLEKFSKARTIFEEFAAATDLKDKIKKMTNDCLSNLRNADVYLNRNTSQALEYVEKAKNYALDIESDPELTTHPDIATFFNNYESKLRAFEEKYEKIIITDLMRTAKSSVKNNLNFVKSNSHDIARQLDFVSIARDKLIEIQTNDLLMKQPEMVDFVSESEQQIEEIEKQIQDKMVEKEAKESISNITLRFLWARAALSGHKLAKAKECIEEAEDLFSTLSSFPSLSEHPLVVEFSVKFPTERDELLSDISAKLFDENLKTAKNAVVSALAGLDSYIQKEDFAKAMEILDKGQDKVIELESTFPEEAKDFIVESNDKINRKRDEISASMLALESKRAIQKVETNLRNAHVYLKNHRSQAMEYLEKAIDAKCEIEFNSQLFDRPEIQEFLQKFEEKELEFREEFASLESQEKIKSYISSANTNLNNAKTYFKSHHYTQSREYLEKAKDIQATIISDSEISSIREITSFLDQFEKEVEKFELDCQAKLEEEASKERMGKVKGELMNAETFFSKNPSQSLEYLQRAKDLLDDIRFDSSTISQEWIDDMDKKIESFEIQYNEKVLTEEIKKAKQQIEGNISTSGSYIKTSKQTAIEYLEKAQDQLSEFISKYSSETNFIETVGKSIHDRLTEIHDIIRNEELKSKKDSITTTFNTAKSYVSSHRESQALQILESVSDKLLDLESYPTEKSFIEKMSADVASIQNSIIETAFNEEVKRKIDVCHLHLKNAEMYMSRTQKDRALEYLEQAEEASNALTDEKYLGLSSVDEFFRTFGNSVKKMKQEFNYIIYAQQIKKAKDSILSALSTSKIYFNSQRHDQALEYLKQCKENYEEFCTNENFTLNEGDFVNDTKKMIDTFDAEFTETVYKNQVLALIRKLDSNFSQAQNYLKHNAFDRALASFEASQNDALSLSQYSQHSLAKSRLDNFEQDKETFGKQYAEKALKKDVAKSTSTIKSILHVAQVLLNQKLTARVFEQLEKAKVELGNVNSLAVNLPEMKVLRNEYESFRTKVATELLQDEANAALRRGKRDLEKINIFLSRGLKSQAVEQLKSFVEQHRPILDETSNLTAIPEVGQFKIEVQEIAKKLDLKLESLLTVEQSEDIPTTGDASLFSQFLNFGDCRLETIPMSTSISSKVFNTVKQYNTDAGTTNQNIRKFIREVQTLDIPRGDKISQLYSYQDLSRNLKKLVKVEDSINSNASEDENAKKIVTLVSTYKTWCDSVEEKVKEITIRQEALHKVNAHTAFALEHIAHGESYLKGGTIPAITKIILGAALQFSNQLSVDLHDYELFMKGYEEIVNCRRMVELYSEKYAGFPAEEKSKILDELEKRALKGHVKHCIRGFTVVSPAKRSLYYRALRRFPLARKYALKELEEQKYTSYIHNIPSILKDKHYVFEDPFEGQTFPDAFPENEEDYLPTYELIRPADPSAPEGNSPHESENPMYWNKIKQNHTGEIIFAKVGIDSNEKNEEILCNEFTYGKDEIHGRAIWRNSINNFAIAKEKETGKFLYPPKNEKSAFTTELVYFVKIDGNRIETFDRYSSFFHDEERSDSAKEPGSAVNFFDWNQSMKVFVLSNKVNYFDTYQRTSVLRFNREFSQLTPGKHEVEIELCYLIRSSNDNRNSTKSKFPTFTSMLSHPIAKGSFSVIIPDNMKMLNLLPKRTSPLPTAGAIEQATLEMLRESTQWGKRVPKRENIVQTWATSEIYVTRRHWLSEVPIEWGTNFTALIYRNPEEGWDQEEVALFDLSTFSEQEKKQIPPCVGIGVGSSVRFEPDLVPEDVLQGCNRYSGDWKDIYKKLSENDYKRFYVQPWTEY